MSRFLARLTGTDSPEETSELSNLSPMGQRLLNGLSLIGQSSPQLAMLIKGLGKHMARNPLPDAEIVEALTWAKDMIDAVLTEPDPTVVPVPVADLTPEDHADLASLLADGTVPFFPPVSTSPDDVTMEGGAGDE